MARTGYVGFLALVALAALVRLIGAGFDFRDLADRIDLLRRRRAAALELVVQPFLGEEALLVCDDLLQAAVGLNDEPAHRVHSLLRSRDARERFAIAE